MTWILTVVALLAGSVAWVSWRRLVKWRARMQTALADAQRLGIVSCIACGQIDEPVIISGDTDARVACRHCHGFALEAVEGAERRTSA
jgi:hypothetical protein